MNTQTRFAAAEAFESAFHVAPEVAAETGGETGLGIYGWKTPVMEGFELPETDDLIVALHLGGSRQVRAVTAQGLSRARSTPGLVTILPPGRPVAFQTAGAVTLMTLHVPKPACLANAMISLAQDSSPRFAFRDAYVSASMEALLRAARGERSLPPGYVAKLSDALLCHLSQWATQTASGQAAAKPGIDQRVGAAALGELFDYIDSHLAEPLPLNELAARAGVCRAAFTRAFRAATGLSAHQYLTQRRIAAAMRLLHESDLDLAYIAQETGFSSQSHFTEIFRALTGVTPRRFREDR